MTMNDLVMCKSKGWHITHVVTRDNGGNVSVQ